MTSELQQLIHKFLAERYPEADLADATVSVGLILLAMITVSVPVEEQDHVFHVWLDQMKKAWPKVRAITNQNPG